MNEGWSLTIPHELMERLRSHLFPGDWNEHGAVLVAGLTTTSRGNRLLARELFVAQDGIDYVRGRYGYHMLKGEFITEKIVYCRDNSLVYLAVHCHGGTDRVGFSGIDLDSHERGYPSLLSISGHPVGALVFAENAVAGDIWLPDRQRVGLKEAVVVGNSIRRIYPESPNRPATADPMYDRQSRIFGDRGQNILSELKVGIIGAGGAGSLIVEYLARLGVGHLTVVDPDTIENTNTPRVVGSTQQDVVNREFKVNIAERVAKTANPTIQFDGIVGNVVDEDMARLLADCDYLFLAADTMQARLIFNALVHQFLIPGVQVGVKVQINQDTGDILDVFCASRPVLPDGGCLQCNELISASQLQDEAMSEEERHRQRYIDDPLIEVPSVITLNAISASHSVNYFMFAVTGLGDNTANSSYLRWLPQQVEMKYELTRRVEVCVECGTSPKSRLARGDQWPLPTRRTR